MYGALFNWNELRVLTWSTDGIFRVLCCKHRTDQLMFRILSLDGGEIKGAFSAAVLAALERDTGKAAPDYFDLIVGTSTGGGFAVCGYQMASSGVT